MGKKKITTLHLDEKVLNKAKREIGNISVFVENCLKAYLGLDNPDFNISLIDDELDKMKRANLNIHLLSGQEQSNEIKSRHSKQEIDEAWLKVWGEYRVNEICNYKNVDKLSQLVDYNSDEIMDMMESLLTNCDRKQLLKCETFEGAEKQLKQFLIE